MYQLKYITTRSIINASMLFIKLSKCNNFIIMIRFDILFIPLVNLKLCVIIFLVKTIGGSTYPMPNCPILYIGIMWFCNTVVPNVRIVLCFFTFIIPNSNLSSQILFAFVMIVRSTNIQVVAMAKCRLVKLSLLLFMKSPLT